MVQVVELDRFDPPRRFVEGDLGRVSEDERRCDESLEVEESREQAAR